MSQIQLNSSSLKPIVVTFNKKNALEGEGASPTPNIVKTNAKVR